MGLLCGLPHWQPWANCGAPGLHVLLPPSEEAARPRQRPQARTWYPVLADGALELRARQRPWRGLRGRPGWEPSALLSCREQRGADSSPRFLSPRGLGPHSLPL